MKTFRTISIKRSIVGGGVLLVALSAVATTPTLIRLSTQVQGVLAAANGGTGATSLGSGVTVSGGALTTVGQQPYPVAMYYPGSPPNSQLVTAYKFAIATSFPGNFTGAECADTVNATSTATFTIKKNGSSAGTIVFATNGTCTYTTSGGTTLSFAIGDEMTIIAPGTADSTLSDPRVTLLGAR